MKRLLLILLLLPVFADAQIITTVAGNGLEGFFGDGGPAINAEFSTPSGITADKFGNFYIADDHNNVIHKVNSAGKIGRAHV